MSMETQSITPSVRILEPEQMESMFNGLDNMSAKLPADKQQRMRQLLDTSVDPNADKALFANAAYLADSFKVPISEVSKNVDNYRRSYATQMGWTDAADDNQKFYARVGQKYQNQRDENAIIEEGLTQLFGAFSKGDLDPLPTFNAALDAAKTKPGYDPKRLDLYKQVASERWRAWTETGQHYPDVVDTVSQYFQLMRNPSGQQYEAQLQARKAATAALQTVPREEMDLVLGIAARGLEAEEDKALPLKGVERAGRGISETIVKGVEGLQDLAGRINFVQPSSDELGTRYAARRLEAAINGTIDPNTSKQWLAKGILDAAQGLPATVAMFTPAGVALNVGAFTEMARGNMEDAGVSAEDAQNLAPIAGTALTALNLVTSKVLLGKAVTTGAETWMAKNIAGAAGKQLIVGYAKNAATTVAIDGLVVASTTGAQMLTEPGIQSVGALLDESIPQVQWTGSKGELRKIKDATPEAFAAMVPIIAIGAGAGMLRNRAYADTIVKNETALRAIGMKEKAITEIMAADNAELAVETLKENFPSRGEPNAEAIAELNKETAVPVESAHTITELDNGGYVVTDSQGNLVDFAATKREANRIANVADEVPPLKAEVTESGDYVIKNEAGAIVDQAGSGEMAAKSIAEANEVKRYEAKTEAERAVGEIDAETKASDVESTIGVKNASMDEALSEMGLEPTTRGEKVTFKGEIDKAVEAAKEDPQSGQRLVDELSKKPRSINGEEVAALAVEVNRLARERDAASKALAKAAEKGDQQAEADAQARVDAVNETYYRTADALKKSGTSTAQGLALRRIMLQRDYSLAQMEYRARDANGGRALTPEQRAEVASLHERIATLDAEVARYIAERETKQTAERAKKSPPEGRSRIAKALNTQAEKARARIAERMKEGRVLAGLDPQDALDYTIIGADLIVRGATKFKDFSTQMVKEFGDTVKPHLEDLFNRAKAYVDDERVKARREKPSSAELSPEERRTEAKKTRIQKSIDKIKDKLARNDFAPEPKRTPIHMDEQANLLQAQLDAAQAQFDAALDKYKYDSKSGLGKAGAQALSVWDSARSLMASGELSFMLRQGGGILDTHPVIWAKAIPDAIRSLAANPDKANAIDLKTRLSPSAKIAEANGLFLSNPHAGLSAKEEMFINKLINRIPVLRNFEQASRVFLNRIRLESWDAMRKSAPVETKAVLQQSAKLVNQLTGRGSLGPLERNATQLARVMFSPRFAASRAQLLLFHSAWQGDKASRKIVAKQYLRMAIGRAAVLGLSYAALDIAADNEEDRPRISFDPRQSGFLKIKTRNTTIDMMSGLQQYMTFATQTATLERTNAKGEVQSLSAGKGYKPLKWSDVAINFARSKAHPVVGAVWTTLDGRDLVGNKVSPTEQGLNFVMPMTWSDMKSAAEDLNIPQGALVNILAFGGAGLNTIPPDAKNQPLTESAGLRR